MSGCPKWLSPATIFLMALMLQVHCGVFVEGQVLVCPSDYRYDGPDGGYCVSDANCPEVAPKCCFDSQTRRSRCKYPETVSCPPLSYYYGQVRPCSSSRDCVNRNQLCCPHHTGQTVCKYGV